MPLAVKSVTNQELRCDRVGEGEGDRDVGGGPQASFYIPLLVANL